jgi:hypothetical protein
LEVSSDQLCPRRGAGWKQREVACCAGERVATGEKGDREKPLLECMRLEIARNCCEGRNARPMRLRSSLDGQNASGDGHRKRRRRIDRLANPDCLGTAQGSERAGPQRPRDERGQYRNPEKLNAARHAEI